METGLNGYASDFLVDFGRGDVDDILDKYLTKKHDIK